MKKRLLCDTLCDKKAEKYNEVLTNARKGCEICIILAFKQQKTCISAGFMELMARFELATSSLPRMRSTD